MGGAATSGFGPEDLELLTEAVSRNGSLLGAASAAKLIEREAAYPIHSINDLKGVFDRRAGDDKTARVGECTVSWEKIDGYLGKARFPIHDRNELLSALILAFEMEHSDVLAAAQAKHGARRT